MSGGTGRREGSLWPNRDGELHEAMASESSGLLLPLQWVADFVGVSRAAVHKRAKSGGLTVFSYIIEEGATTILGRVKHKETRKRYDLVPFSECEQWRWLLLELANEEDNGDTKE